MATITSGESIHDIAGDVLAHVRLAIHADLSVCFTTVGVAEVATIEQVRVHLEDMSDILRDVIEKRLCEHVREVAS